MIVSDLTCIPENLRSALKSLPGAEFCRVCLPADDELLNQKRNDLDSIETQKILHASLAARHYENFVITSRAKKTDMPVPAA